MLVSALVLEGMMASFSAISSRSNQDQPDFSVPYEDDGVFDVPEGGVEIIYTSLDMPPVLDK